MTNTVSGRPRVIRRLVIAVVVLVVLLVAADRIGDYVAERAAASTIQSSQHLNSRPDVQVDGFPFLTQFAAGKFDKVTITAAQVPIGSGARTLQVDSVRAVLNDVRVSRDFSSFRADRASATAFITYGELGKTLHADVSYAGQGRVKATESVSVAGQKVSGSITARPTLRNDRLAFDHATVSGSDQLAGPVAALLTKVFDVAVPLQAIPFGLRVRTLDADSSGLHVRLTGRNLSYVN